MKGNGGSLSLSLRRRLYLPAYRTVESARLVQARPQLVTRWFHGYDPVFGAAKKPGAALSYLQLVETAFAASFRESGVSLQKVRKAREYLSKMFQVEYPFAQLVLRTDGVHILKELEEREDGHEPKLIVADKAGQVAWPEIVLDRFAQFEYEFEIALRWHPRGKSVPIVIDPRISFGAPIVEGAGVATWALRERYEAGKTLEEIKDDFGVSDIELGAALRFEGLSAAA